MNLRKDLLLSGALMAMLFAAGSASASDLSVGLDQTRTMHVEQQIATLSIGNPAIADVTVRDGKTLFVLGKSFGRTNILALNSKGETILDTTILVSDTKDGKVTVYRGSKQASYDCAMNCQPALMPGDDKAQFDRLQEQITNKVKISASGGN